MAGNRSAFWSILFTPLCKLLIGKFQQVYLMRTDHIFKACFNIAYSLDMEGKMLQEISMRYKLFATLMKFLNEIFEKVDFEKNQLTTKKHAKLPRGAKS